MNNRVAKVINFNESISQIENLNLNQHSTYFTFFIKKEYI